MPEEGIEENQAIEGGNMTIPERAPEGAGPTTPGTQETPPSDAEIQRAALLAILGELQAIKDFQKQTTEVLRIVFGAGLAERGPLEERGSGVRAIREVVKDLEESEEPTRYIRTLWTDRTEVRGVLYAIPNIELRRALLAEVLARMETNVLYRQYLEANGDEGTLGGLIGAQGREELRPVTLRTLSSLLEDESGESVSWHISRAITLYLNFMGRWAEQFVSTNTPQKVDEVRQNLAQHKIDAKEAQRRLDAIQEALSLPEQKRIAAYSQNPVMAEAVIPGLEEQGLRVGLVKEKILTNLPEDLVNYGENFAQQVLTGKQDQEYISLSQLYGQNLLCQSGEEVDIRWMRHATTRLCGSPDGETQAFRFMLYTMEAALLNRTWDGAVDPSDALKLLYIKKRRQEEARKNNVHGPDATLRMYPEQSGTSWIRRAKIKDEMGKEVTVYEELQRKPFHKIRWETLNPGSYVGDFLLPNARSLGVFKSLMTKNLDFDTLGGDNPEALNKAFKSSFGDKEKFPVDPNYNQKPRTIEAQQKTLENPWVAYAIGIISLHHPEGKKLPDMRLAPPENQQWSYQLDSEEKRRKIRKPTYDETFKIGMLESGFLTEDELRFVEWYCNISSRMPIVGRRF